jgi:hypothetical protein
MSLEESENFVKRCERRWVRGGLNSAKEQRVKSQGKARGERRTAGRANSVDVGQVLCLVRIKKKIRCRQWKMKNGNWQINSFPRSPPNLGYLFG